MLKKEIKTKQDLMKLIQAANIRNLLIDDIEDDFGLTNFMNEIKKKRISKRKITLILLET